MRLPVEAFTHILVLFVAASISTQAHGASAGTALPSIISTTICPRKQSILSSSRQVCSLALDDKSAPSTWEPWAYRPTCVVENRQDKRPNLGVGDDVKYEGGKLQAGDGNRIKYCLFTNSFFGEYGISILARPEAAANAASILWDVYHSTFPSPETVPNLNLEPAYRVVDMPEKGGKGVVATRHIKHRETFMVDYAAIIGDLHMWGSISQKEGHPLLDRAAEQLVDSSHVTTLSRGAGGDGVEGIIKANTFRTYLNGAPQKTLFPRISVKFCLAYSRR